MGLRRQSRNTPDEDDYQHLTYMQTRLTILEAIKRELTNVRYGFDSLAYQKLKTITKELELGSIVKSAFVTKDRVGDLLVENARLQASFVKAVAEHASLASSKLEKDISQAKVDALLNLLP